MGHRRSLMLLFLVYPTIGRVVFQTFDCAEVEQGLSVLRTDHKVQCYTAEYDGLIALASALLVVYAVGFPLLCATLLAYNVDVPFLSEIYLPKYYWFEIKHLAVKLLVTTIIVVIFSGQLKLQAVYLLLITFGSLLVVVSCMPYKMFLDNVVCIATQLCLCLLLVCGVTRLLNPHLVKLNEDANELGEGSVLITAVDALMVLIFVIPFCVAAWATVFDVHRTRMLKQDEAVFHWKKTLNWAGE
jgi:hypothetical protein